MGRYITSSKIHKIHSENPEINKPNSSNMHEFYSAPRTNQTLSRRALCARKAPNYLYEISEAAQAVLISKIFASRMYCHSRNQTVTSSGKQSAPWSF